MATIIKDLGVVTAYAYAVEGGYTGTEEEFEELLGNIATDLAEIENISASATTLSPSSPATASYNNGVLSFGIPQGEQGVQGETGQTGATGATGNGIASIAKTGTSGLVDTYTITFTNGNTTTFTVTNGQDGEVTEASLEETLEDYARIDGYYEELTSGNAEQLVSTVGVTDQVPYNFRTSGGSADIGDREVDEIVGGTVAWNQLSKVRETHTTNSIVCTDNNDGSVTLNGTSDGSGALTTHSNIKTIKDHIYCICANSDYFSAGHTIFTSIGGNISISANAIRKESSSGSMPVTARCNNLETFDNAKLWLITIDLTQLFGSTVADYIYTLESGTAGAGVAWFRKLFPKPYYAYNAGALESVNVSAHKTVGYNAWDEEWELGGIDSSTGQETVSSTNIRAKNYIPVVQNTDYYVCTPALMYVVYYDANKKRISNKNISSGGGSLTTPDGTRYIRFAMSSTYGTTYKNDICISLYWDGERAGEYEAYNLHTYPLDSSLTLRGIPKLDANNKLYYDGDTYASDGTVTRRYGIVDLGTLNWSENSTYPGLFNGDLPTHATYISTPRHVCSIFIATYSTTVISLDKSIAISAGGNKIYAHDDSYGTAAAFKTAMSGVYLVYELATSTTESADPYQNPQIVDDLGTEEYVDYAESQGTRDVAVPVGHNTKYQSNLRAKLEMLPNSPSGNGDYILRQTSGINEFVQYVPEIPTRPTTDGTYVLKCTVSGGTPALTWVSE